MREYIRHPSDIPIEIRTAQDQAVAMEEAQDISYGGLAFYSDTAMRPRSLISLHIPHVMTAEESTLARVAWCRRINGKYTVGVEFQDSTEAYRVRMVEQVCHIESYRRDIETKEGRSLSSEEAAAEWIGRYAGDFPDP